MEDATAWRMETEFYVMVVSMEGCTPNDTFSDRGRLVCGIICNEKDGIRFNALKRRSGLHQEILSRILKRDLDLCGYTRINDLYISVQDRK